MSLSARAPLNAELGPRESDKSISPVILGRTLRVIGDGLVRSYGFPIPARLGEKARHRIGPAICGGVGR